MNMAMTKLVPAMMARLETNASSYNAWAAEHYAAGFVSPWVTPKESWSGGSAKKHIAKSAAAVQTHAVSGGRRYRLLTQKDFAAFRATAVSAERWTEVHRSKPGDMKVVSSTRQGAADMPGEGLTMVKVVAEFPHVPPETLYNALHDPDYRRAWDTNMVHSSTTCELDARNDVGYYAAKMPWPLKDRDFVLARGWMEFEDGEYAILNYSVVHTDLPVSAKFVRGNSHTTGYFLQPLAGGAGCRLSYMTHGDIGGSIPKFVLNSATTTLAPKMVTELAATAMAYPAWAAQHHPSSYVPPWKTAKMPWAVDDSGEATPEPGQRTPFAATSSSRGLGAAAAPGGRPPATSLAPAKKTSRVRVAAVYVSRAAAVPVAGAAVAWSAARDPTQFWLMCALMLVAFVAGYLAARR
jgi:hypothetical protein